MGKIAIFAGGMASSLSDLKMGCATARTGITRHYDHWELSFFDKESGEMEPVSVQSAWGGHCSMVTLVKRDCFGLRNSLLMILSYQQVNAKSTGKEPLFF